MDVPIRYSVDLGSVKTNQIRVHMTVDAPPQGEPTLDVALPFMSPGSPVNSRNHTAKLTQLDVRDASGAPLSYDKLENGGWRIRNAGRPLQIDYTLLADDFASCKNQLNGEHAYLNGAAAFMFVQGHDRDLPATVELRNVPDASWQSISTLPALKGYPNAWYATTFQELADANIEVGHLDKAEGDVDGIHVTVVKHGHSPFTRLAQNEVSAAQNLADFKQIYKAFTAEYGKFPSQRYVVSAALPPEVESPDRYTIIKHYVNADASLAAGFEHYHGHELTFSRLSEDGIHRAYDDSARVLENHVMAHELGHKLLGKFVQHDGIDSCEFAREHPSDGLWLTEGVTEWLGTMTQRRAGLITPQQYLDRLENNINRYLLDYRVDPTNGREDSMDAQHGNSEYYTKGAVLAAMLDLEILHLSGGEKSFKDVLIGLKDQFGGKGTFHKLDDVRRAACSVVAKYPGASERMASIFHDYLEDRKPIDFNAFLAHAGLEVAERTDRWTPDHLYFANAALDVDSNGQAVLSRGVPPAAQAARPFRTIVPSAGLSLAWDDAGALKLASITPLGPAFKAGLTPFSGRAIEKLTATLADGRTVDLPVSRSRDLPSNPAGPIQSLSFTFTQKSLFDGTSAPTTLTVPLETVRRAVIQPRRGADYASSAVRDRWLRQLDPGELD